MSTTIEQILYGNLSDSALLDALSALSPEELESLVLEYNWDDGYALPTQILMLPRCDRRTALRMYWRGGAQWYRQFSRREEVPLEPEGWDLCLKVEDMIARGSFQARLAPFDPRDDDGSDHTADYLEHPSKRTIPADMYGPLGPPRTLSDELMEEAMAHAKAIDPAKPAPHAMRYLKQRLVANTDFGALHQTINQRLGKAG
ncbi:MAG: DUF4274 domain-containing protein [Pseudomonadota bacterium]|nr:DUF4274 domain-containing protein [Pseudomonadota bacterium]